MLGNAILFFLIYKFLWAPKRRKLASKELGPWSSAETIPDSRSTAAAYAIFVIGVLVVFLGLNAIMPMDVSLRGVAFPIGCLVGLVGIFQLTVRIPQLPFFKNSNSIVRAEERGKRLSNR